MKQSSESSAVLFDTESAPAGLSYQSGFGNEFATEAVPGALPVGQNAPQKHPLGLYTEQFSGTPFTAPRAVNRRTWTYRIRPSVTHRPYEEIPARLIRSGPFLEVPTTPNQLRWDPLPIPTERTDFVDGIVTLGGNGDPAMQTGLAIHLYAANASMEDRFFYTADGELLIVPQLGALRFHTELGILEVKPGEICVIPRGVKFRVVLEEKQARGYICENYGLPFRLPELGPIGANGLANPRDFKAPVAAYEDRDGEFHITAKFLGRLWSAFIDHSPLDVVAWHGNYAPYKYDLALFNCINTVSFDHPDPSIYTVLSAPSDCSGHGQLRLRHLPAALDGGRAHVPSAVVPSQPDERIHGPGVWRVRREGGGIRARRREPAQLHGGPRAGRGNVRARHQRRIETAVPGQHAGIHVRNAARGAADGVRHEHAHSAA